jgi:hypothetical protein
LSQMKNDAIVCNIGHFDLEIDMAPRKPKSKPAAPRSRTSAEHRRCRRQIHVRRRSLDRGASRRPLWNLGCARPVTVVRDEQLVLEPGARSSCCGPRQTHSRSAFTCFPRSSTKR